MSAFGFKLKTTQMKLNHLIILLFLSPLFLTMNSCSKDKESDSSSGQSKISAIGESESHNSGQNCMNCHKSGGHGEGIFTVAGTVYNNQLAAIYPDAIVKLYTQANGGGTLRGTVYADSKGNFYTTAGIDFSGGLYPSITGKSGNIAYMASSITQGACNNCHGNSASKLFVY
jgi:hypothetical protein